MADEVANDVVTQEELDVVAGQRKDRKAYLKSVEASGGKAAKQHAEHVLDAAYDLATAIAATDDPNSPEAVHFRAEVARVRGGIPAPA